MKPYSMQELEECGFLSKMFGSKPTENGWKELNNLLAAAPDALAVSADDVHHALKKCGGSSKISAKCASCAQRPSSLVCTSVKTTSASLR